MISWKEFSVTWTGYYWCLGGTRVVLLMLPDIIKCAVCLDLASKNNTLKLRSNTRPRDANYPSKCAGQMEIVYVIPFVYCSGRNEWNVRNSTIVSEYIIILGLLYQVINMPVMGKVRYPLALICLPATQAYLRKDVCVSWELEILTPFLWIQCENRYCTFHKPDKVKFWSQEI